MKAMYVGDLVKIKNRSQEGLGLILETAPWVNMIRVHWCLDNFYGWHEDKELEVVHESR